MVGRYVSSQPKFVPLQTNAAIAFSSPKQLFCSVFLPTQVLLAVATHADLSVRLLAS